jgi:L-ascorbate metabolism protein UlaG (beta-lactamase superfamily)
VYHAGDSAYYDGFRQIGKVCAPEIALLPIGAYHPESFRRLHMGPDEAIKVFRELRARWLVPMHYGAFRLSFEDLDEPPRWLRSLAEAQGLTRKLRILEEGVPQIF